MSLRDRVRSNLREWYALAAERTGEVAKISIRRYDKFGLSREIERQFAELGSHVYHAIEEGRRDSFDDPAVRALVARIKDLAGDLETKDREIEEFRRQRQAKQAESETARDGVLPTAVAPGFGDAAILAPGSKDLTRP
jgi:hypothetical protein